jgi:hypothetical protein
MSDSTSPGVTGIVALAWGCDPFILLHPEV